MTKITAKILSVKEHFTKETNKQYFLLNIVDKDYNNKFIKVNEDKNYTNKTIYCECYDSNNNFYNVIDEDKIRIVKNEEDKIESDINMTIENVRLIDVLEVESIDFITKKKTKTINLVVISDKNRVLKVKVKETNKSKNDYLRDLKDKIITLNNVNVYESKTKQKFYSILNNTFIKLNK